MAHEISEGQEAYRGVTMHIERAKEQEPGAVAFFRMPIPLHAMEAMNAAIESLYGPDCGCKEEPSGWLMVVKPSQEPSRQVNGG